MGQCSKYIYVTRNLFLLFKVNLPVCKKPKKKIASLQHSRRRGDLLALPIVIVNMGGEMMYILNQRIEAQKIAPEKASRGIKY